MPFLVSQQPITIISVVGHLKFCVALLYYWLWKEFSYFEVVTTGQKLRLSSGLRLQLFFWGLYLVSEYLANLMHIPKGEELQFLKSVLLSLPALLLATYILVRFGVPHLLQTSRWIVFTLLGLGLAIFLFYARIKWLTLIQYLEHDQVFRIPASKVLKNVIRDYATVALAVCFYIINDYRIKQSLNEKLIKAKAEAEIKLLKGQLHPHFLFNSLNNIYSLALLQSEHTADSILKLTDLLDYLVYRANLEAVPLEKEVQLLENYIGLEKLRYGEHLKVNMKLTEGADGVMVAPLILLPFAENCFKHGGPGPDGNFLIDLSLQFNQQELVFLLKNTKKQRDTAGEMSGGVGLQNLRERLRLIYPQQHRLDITETEDSYQVLLQIKLDANGKI